MEADEELKKSALFCTKCMAATTDERFPASGETFRRKLRARGTDRCPTCGSLVREHCFAPFLGIPLWVLGRYRVKQWTAPFPAEPKIIASRRIRDWRFTRNEGSASGAAASAPSAPQRRSRRVRALEARLLAMLHDQEPGAGWTTLGPDAPWPTAQRGCPRCPRARHCPQADASPTSPVRGASGSRGSSTRSRLTVRGNEQCDCALLA